MSSICCIIDRLAVLHTSNRETRRDDDDAETNSRKQLGFDKKFGKKISIITYNLLIFTDEYYFYLFHDLQLVASQPHVAPSQREILIHSEVLRTLYKK
jgi:hypothetical protein